MVGVASVWEIGDDFADYSYYDHYEYMDPLKGLNGEDPLLTIRHILQLVQIGGLSPNACKSLK